MSMTARVFFAVFVLYLLLAGPAVGWEDSAEMVTAGRFLTPMHPPGAPLPVLVANVAQRIPFGSAPYRLHLFQALLGAGLCAGLFHYLESKTSLFPAFLGAFVFAFFLLPVVVTAEVYVLALTLFFFMAVLVERWWLAGRRARCSDHLLAAFALGLALSCSALLLPYILIPVVVFALDRKDRRKVFVLWGFGLSLGMLPYLLLPFRDLHPSFLSPPNLSSWHELSGFVSGSNFRKQFAAGSYTPSSSAWLWGGLAALMPLLLWYLLKKRKEAGIWAIGALLMAPWLIIPSSRSGLHFFLPAIFSVVILVVLAGEACAKACKANSQQGISGPKTALTVAMFVIVCITPWTPLGPYGKASGAHSFMERMSDALQPGSRIICGEIDVMFLLWYSRGIEGGLDGVEIDPLVFTDKTVVWNQLLEKPPRPGTWFDLDLLDYADRHGKNADWITGLQLDGLLLRIPDSRELPSPAFDERHWLESHLSHLDAYGRRQLGYRYHNLARFLSIHQTGDPRVYAALSKFLLN